MPRQVILNGTVANDGTGDNLRVTATKINSNFEELYASVAAVTPYILPPATRTRLGGVKAGAGLAVSPDGTLQADGIPTKLTDLNIHDGNNGQVLTTDGHGHFTFEDVAAGGATNLDGLTDVTLTSPAPDEILKFDGSQWINSVAPVSINSLGDIPDVSLSGLVSGQVLKYDGTNWINDNTTSGNPFDQDLNTTDSVAFVTTTSEQFLLAGAGTPTVESTTSLNLSAPQRVEVTHSPFKFKSFTATERNALTPENGDVVYNSTVNKLQVYAGGTWVDLH